MRTTEFEQWLTNPHRETLVMGVLNVTPDSFSDGGRFASTEAAISHAREMVRDGAAIIDIGGESTRPGAARVEIDEQIHRLVPVILGLVDLPALISVDTTRATVARAAVEACANLVNDISGGLDDEQMLPTIARLGVPVILMHMRGQPATMQSMASYADVLADVRRHLMERLTAARAAGVDFDRVLLDPGIGFAKTADHNLELMRRLGELTSLGRPLVLGTSRKKFIGTITGEDQPSNRLFGTAATVGWCVANGASIVRVHDVSPMVKVVKMVRAIAGR